jgi:hypothetical protein
VAQYDKRVISVLSVVQEVNMNPKVSDQQHKSDGKVNFKCSNSGLQAPRNERAFSTTVYSAI